MKIKNAYLSRHQPEGYLEDLAGEQARNRILAFLIPSKYEYLSKLKSRIKKWLAQHPTRCPQIKIMDWADLIQHLKKKGLRSHGWHFKEFHDFISEKFCIPPIKFSTGEVRNMYNQETGAIIRKLFWIVNGAHDDSLTEPKGAKQWHLTKLSADAGSHGFYAQDLERKISVWFGIWSEFWEKHGAPLSIGILEKNCPKRVLIKFRQRHKHAVPFDGHLVWGLPKGKPNKHCGEEVRKIFQKEIDYIFR